MFGERKSELLTLRLTDEEVETLESLSDRTGKSKSDVISRACMFFLHSQVNDIYEDLGRSLYGREGGNLGGSLGRGRGGSLYGGRSGDGTDERRTRMTVRVHARLPESMVNRLRNRGMETGESLSHVVRRAINTFASANIIRY